MYTANIADTVMFRNLGKYPSQGPEHPLSTSLLDATPGADEDEGIEGTPSDRRGETLTVIIGYCDSAFLLETAHDILSLGRGVVEVLLAVVETDRSTAYGSSSRKFRDGQSSSPR